MSDESLSIFRVDQFLLRQVPCAVQLAEGILDLPCDRFVWIFDQVGVELYIVHESSVAELKETEARVAVVAERGTMAREPRK
jgi:hypothetical protein